jgi:predicted enzyme related to lactoylglutathione lyase
MTIGLRIAYATTDDIEKSRDFYEGVLGLTLKFRDGDRWIQFATGDTAFALAALDEAPDSAAGVVLVFGVEDLDDAMAKLTAAGTAVGPVRDMGEHGQVASFRDPGGNRVQLFAAGRR